MRAAAEGYPALAVNPLRSERLPDSIRQQGPEAVRRARLVVVTGLLMALASAWIAIMQFRMGSPIVARASIVVSVLSAVAAGGVYVTGGFRVFGGVLCLALFGSAGFVLVSTGGALFTSAFYLGLVPLAATLMLGRGCGVAAAVVTTGLLVAIEALRRSGVAFPVSVDPEVVAQSSFRGALLFQGVLLFIALVYDTLRRRTLEAAEETESRYRALVERSSDLVFELDPAGAIRFISPNCTSVLGWSLDVVIGTDALGSAHPDDAEPVRERIRTLLARRSAPALPVRLPRQDGSWVWYEASATLYDAPGRQPRIVVLARDLTERMRLEEELRQSQKMDAIGRLAGGVAHDFNNLLMVISGYAEILSRTCENEDERASALEVLKAAEQGAALTRQLLAVSRPSESRRRPVDLNGVVAELERMLARLLGGNVELQTRLAPSLPAVLADPSHLEQILVNLAVNARDAMPGGGTLRIATRSEEDSVRLEVSDTGLGMGPEIQERIFEAFFTTKPRGRGTGLGLSVVYSLVKDMEGEIRVDSRLGRGTTMIVELPVSTERPAAEAQIDALGDVCTGDETVLLVEDDKPVRDLVRITLTVAGYHVLEAQDGRDALVVAARHAGEIHLVVSDVVMPHLGGIALAEKLRAARPGVRFLFISGHPEQGGFPAADLPDGDLLAKPFRAADLCLRVREALDGPART